MKKIYYVICGKYKKFEKPKTSYLLEMTNVFRKRYDIICIKFKNEVEKLFTKQ